MFTLEKYDKYIWRINGSIILVACLATIAVCGLVGYKLFSDVFRDREVHDIVNIDEKTKVEEFLRLGYFSSLTGTPYFLIPLSSEQNYSESYYSKSSSNNSRNYLLFNSNTKESHWLWPNNDHLIINSRSIYDKSSEDSKNRLTKGLTFEVVTQDTNKDQRLSPADKSDLLYFDLQTKKMNKIVEQIDRSVGTEQYQDDEILFFYSRSGKSYFKSFKLSSLASTEEQEIKWVK